MNDVLCIGFYFETRPYFPTKSIKIPITILPNRKSFGYDAIHYVATKLFFSTSLIFRPCKIHVSVIVTGPAHSISLIKMSSTGTRILWHWRSVDFETGHGGNTVTGRNVLVPNQVTKRAIYRYSDVTGLHNGQIRQPNSSFSSVRYFGSWGRFKTILLYTRALKCVVWIKYLFFSVWTSYFVWNFKGHIWNSTQIIPTIHWKVGLSHKVNILRVLKFKSPYICFWTPPRSGLGPVSL